MLDFVLFALLLAFIVAALLLGSRAVGLGQCMDCGRSCPPWNAYCWKHSPDNPANHKPLEDM